MDSPASFAMIKTTDSVVSLEAFYGILWMAFAVCFVAFSFRLYVRYHCFRRFLVDDWVMMFALALLLSVAALGQVYMADVYEVVEVENGKKIPDAGFLRAIQDGLCGFGVALTLSLVGISAVKINFLLFFKRLGTQITSYRVFWYIVLFITVACGATNIGLMDYKCVFGSLTFKMTHCTQRSTLRRYFNFQLASVVLDVVSDVLIICFPVAVLWNVRISLRKKIVLSCTFGLVALTIAVTIVRGSVFGGTYKSFNANEDRNLNPGWMWFWLYIEFAVAFLIACIVSFRALFAQREKRAYEHQVRAQQELRQESPASQHLKNLGVFRRARYIHDSLLQTLKTIETMDDMRLPEPESGRFSPTFLTEIESAKEGNASTESPARPVKN